MSDQDTSFANNPFLQFLSFIFNAVTVLLFIGTLGVAAAAMPTIWRDFRTAPTPREKGYHGMLFVMCWCLVYGLVMIIVLALDAGWWKSDMMNWWPTISFIFDWDMSHSDSVAFDVMGSFVLAVFAWAGSTQFGNEDEGIFVPPNRVIAKDHCADVIESYEAFLLTNPRLQPEWQKGWNAAERRSREVIYKEKLSDMIDTVRSVHHMWRKRPPF